MGVKCVKSNTRCAKHDHTNVNSAKTSRQMTVSGKINTATVSRFARIDVEMRRLKAEMSETVNKMTGLNAYK